MIDGIRRGLIAGAATAALVFGLGIYPQAVAMAQQATEAPGTVSLQPLFGTFIPYVAELFLAGMFTLAGIVVAWVKKKWGIDAEARLKEIEARHRASLHSAITTAVAGQIAKGRLGSLSIQVGSEEVASIIRYVRDSVPDAIDFFKPDEAVIANLATAKAVELQASLAAPAALAAVMPVQPTFPT